MPKKKVNGFFLFMRDYMAKEERKGRKINMGQAQNEAGKIWTSMNDQQKGVYNQKAKNETVKLNTKEPEKLTSQGIPLSRIEKEKKERDTEERLMKKEIEDTVKINFLNETLEDYKFYFVMANYFSKNTEGTIYLPAEIGISEYCLKDGVTNKFHSFINPGVGMFGYTYEAKRHSEDTHKLPIPPDAFGEKNLQRLYTQILAFIQGNNTNAKNYPPVYTHKDSVHIVKAVLGYLSTDGDEDFPDIKVYPLQYLFFTLKKATAEVGDNKKPESIHITDAILNRDQHEYCCDISCDYHEQKDAGKYCALSYVIRWGYMFSEYMCNDMAIEMKPGYHVPLDSVQVAVKQLNESMCDQFDDISEVSFKNSSKCSVYTEPKVEPQNWEVSSVTSKSTGITVATTANTNNDDNFDGKKENLWAKRNKPKPKLPTGDLLGFASFPTGHGRGILISEAKSNYSSSSRATGRGRCFMDD